MGVVDEVLPRIILETLQIYFTMFGALIMLAIINQWLIIVAFILTTLMFLIKKYFAKTVNILRRYEATGKRQIRSLNIF